MSEAKLELEKHEAGKTFIAHVDQDPALKAFLDERNETIKRMDERKDFLDKQMENLTKDLKVSLRSWWGKVESWCVEKGHLPPDYTHDSETHALEFSHGVLYRINKPKESEADQLKRLFSTLFGK